MRVAALAALAVIAALAGLAAPALAQAPAAAPTATTASDWRVLDPANTWVIDTTKGRVIVELYPQLAPNHVARIKTLTRQGYYDGANWYRVVEGFMAQGGDKDKQYRSKLPNLKGEFLFKRPAGAAFYSVAPIPDAEVGFIGVMPVVLQKPDADGSQTGWVNFCPGIASFPHGAAPDTANSQFFLMRGAAGLDKTFTAFGRVVVGEEVVRALKVGEPVVNPDKMTRVRILADLPAAQRVEVRVMDTMGPAFAARIQQALKDKPNVSLCELEIPAEVH